MGQNELEDADQEFVLQDGEEVADEPVRHRGGSQDEDVKEGS